VKLTIIKKGLIFNFKTNIKQQVWDFMYADLKRKEINFFEALSHFPLYLFCFKLFLIASPKLIKK
jgi:hypothetical protein